MQDYDKYLGNRDITDSEEVKSFFKEQTFHYCINCAAYTAVDKAESDKKSASMVNAVGAKNLAIACEENKVALIQISTDFVFDGTKSIAYTEADKTNPIGVYSLTKLEGEQEVTKNLVNHFIIRTSWLYSEHGNNFMKTMIKLSQDRDLLNIVADQIGTPTYAKDLAETIMKVLLAGMILQKQFLKKVTLK